MANNKKFAVAELDFDGIKSNLKEFLKGQDELQDYDFEGSTINTLLDILAYNTHYNALYQNLTLNEMFLDSASKRDSVLSIAKMLGYTPRSATCATVTVDITLTTPTPGPSVITIPKYQPFQAKKDGKTFNFYNTGSLVATTTDNLTYQFSDIVLTQGTPVKNTITVANGTKFLIGNTNIDLNTLKVNVQENSDSSFLETFVKNQSISELESTTKVYFIKENEGGLFEIYFGDGNIGRALEPGNIVHIEYFVSGGEEANGCRYFSYNGSTVVTGATTTVISKAAAANGREKETRDSIRYNAPRYYAAQNRAVTTEDYKTIIYQNFSAARSVSIWGGEDNSPPQYGKVFICVKPTGTSNKLTNVQKAELVTSILNKRNVVSVQPEIVDPEYINISLHVTAYYNPQETTKTENEIKNIIKNTIFKYDDDDLQTFDGVYRHSKMSQLIDNCDDSITNNVTTVLLRREVFPSYNVSAQYIINLVNPIYQDLGGGGALQSTGFYIFGSNDIHYLDDDGSGNVRLFRYGANAAKIITNPTIGTIDYTGGYVDIRNLHIVALADIDLEFSIKPLSNDVTSALTQIAEIARDHLTIDVIPDPTAAGDLGAGFNYIHTTSRT